MPTQDGATVELQVKGLKNGWYELPVEWNKFFPGRSRKVHGRARLEDAMKELIGAVQGSNTVKRKRKVAIIGYAPSSRGLVPWNDPDMERWGLNNMYVLPDMTGAGPDGNGLGYSRWFQIHNPSEIQVRDKNHSKWLENQKNVPIVYMQRHYENIPSSVEYPVNRAIEIGRGYLTNSISQMAAMVLLESIQDAPKEIRERYGCRWIRSATHFTDLYLYGIDMATHAGGVGHTEGEFSYQRPSVEYWLGLIEGFGINIHIPVQSDILKCVRVYGYEGAQTIQNKMKERYSELSTTITGLQGQLEQSQQALLQAVGARNEGVYWDRNWVMDTDNEWVPIDEQGKAKEAV